MKVLFLLKSKNAPSTRIRILNLFPVLEKFSIYPEARLFPKSSFKRISLFRQCSDYDLIIIQKKLLGILDIKILKYYAKAIAYDFDDAVYLKDAGCSLPESCYISKKREKLFKRTINSAKIIIPANQELYNATNMMLPAKNQKSITIVPSPVETEEIPIKTEYSLSSTPVIGWVGSRTSLIYLKYILPALQKIQANVNFELRIVADQAPKLNGINVNLIPWKLKTQYNEIIKFDIGIMPLSEDPYSRGKSAYKLLQYMAAAVPSVCSPVGMNKELSDSGTACLAAKDNDEFTSTILKLLMDESLRRKLGKNARKLVIEKYSIEAVGTLLAGVIRSQQN